MKSIVIGSGFGGIAAALRLKAKNHNVTLIENTLTLEVELGYSKKMALHLMLGLL